MNLGRLSSCYQLSDQARVVIEQALLVTRLGASQDLDSYARPLSSRLQGLPPLDAYVPSMIVLHVGF